LLVFAHSNNLINQRFAKILFKYIVDSEYCFQPGADADALADLNNILPEILFKKQEEEDIKRMHVNQTKTNNAQFNKLKDELRLLKKEHNKLKYKKPYVDHQDLLDLLFNKIKDPNTIFVNERQLKLLQDSIEVRNICEYIENSFKQSDKTNKDYYDAYKKRCNELQYELSDAKNFLKKILKKVEKLIKITFEDINIIPFESLNQKEIEQAINFLNDSSCLIKKNVKHFT